MENGRQNYPDMDVDEHGVGGYPYPDSDVDEHGVGVELPADGDEPSNGRYDPDQKVVS